jgi:hypothetical protein
MTQTNLCKSDLDTINRALRKHDPELCIDVTDEHIQVQARNYINGQANITIWYVPPADAENGPHPDDLPDIMFEGKLDMHFELVLHDDTERANHEYYGEGGPPYDAATATGMYD